ncbi:acyl-CoA dehydrogenase family protein [Micromonospora olivasterospora]|uniref:Acyl-CoA dehydrogenase n=1 Tax=Micromonospora olivasterospora TaxID=1880 RepID=A0A562I2M2_MICOL|nr:acyl-CoA dehydrogenase [Micromonospora olivasterospora]TWH65291.1 acyl-CoA dehydrogenase [Micromonospora olivasterospora]
MINFDPNPFEAELLAETARQATVYRRYAREFDRPQDHDLNGSVTMPVPEEAEFLHVRNLLRQRIDETSGYDLMEALIYLEECKGAKPFYPRPVDADAFDTNLSKFLLKAVGTPEQYEKWGDGYGFLSWGMTEPGAGSDPSSMRMTAVRDSATGDWVLNGEKIFISQVQEAAGIVTMARVPEEGPHSIGLFVVEKDRPGFTLGRQFKKLGIRNRDLASFALDDYRIPDVNRLRGSLKDALNEFNGTRSLIAAEALGLISAALDITRGALEEAGVEIDYTASAARSTAAADRFIDLEAEYEAGYMTLLHTRWLHQTQGRDKVRTAMAKVAAAGGARRIIRECMDILGPNSTSKDYFLEQAMRDSRITDIYEGPGEVLRLLIARDMLGYSARELN